MTKCAAFRCPNRNEADAKSKGITFHRLPRSNPDILLQWIVNMKRKNWIPSKRTLLCSDHFTPECFIKRRHRSLLKSDAVPTVFKVLEHSKKNVPNGKATGTKKKWDYNDERLAKAKQLANDFMKQFPKAVDVQKGNETTDIAKSRRKVKAVDKIKEEMDVFTDKTGEEKKEPMDKIILSDNHVLWPHPPVQTRQKEKLAKNEIRMVKENAIHDSSLPLVHHQRKGTQDVGHSIDPSELKSNNLNVLLNSLSERRLLCNYGLEILYAFGEYPKGLMKLGEEEDDLHLVPVLVTDDGMSELKNFATALYLSSPVAFNIVSKMFKLPTLLELKDQIKVNEYRPGFTQEALALLKSKAYRSTSNQICSIMFDYVNIKEQAILDGASGKYFGYVDIGGGQGPYDTDEVPLATNVLLFTAVGLGRDWKLPFGYFLCKGLSGEILKTLTEEAIFALEECGLRVRALVCSGSRCSIKMGELFGCKIRSRKTTGKRVVGKKFVGITTHFTHPFDTNRKIFLVFGIRHSLKLLGNLLADKSSLLSSAYGMIDWKFFKQLKDNATHPFPANGYSLDPSYIKFCHLQRAICLCQSNFNSSVSSALELADELKLKGYEDVECTSSFATDVQRAFDLLNSRNPVTAEEKPSVCPGNLEEMIESMSDIADRLINLESIVGRRITEEGRWTSVTLIAFTLISVSHLATELLKENALRYFSTYRVDLDHLDMVMSSLQRLGGWVEVPSALEFRDTYKKFLRRSSENTFHNYDFEGEDLTVGQGEIYLYKSPSTFKNHNRPYGLHVFHSHHLTDLWADVVNRARFVVQRVSERLSCPECTAAMLSEDYLMDAKNLHVNRTNVKPSRYVMKLLKTSQSLLKMKLIQSSQISEEHLVSYVFREYSTFTHNLDLPEIVFNHFVEEPYHIICLTKGIIRTFITFKLQRRMKLKRHRWL